MIERASQLRRLRKLISDFAYENFYGEITIRFEHGNIVYVEIIEKRRLPDVQAQDLLADWPAGVSEVRARELQTGTPEEPMALVQLIRRGKLEELADPTVVLEEES